VGNAEIASRRKQYRRQQQVKSLWRALAFVKPYWSRVAILLLSSLLHGGLWGAMIWLTGETFQECLVNKNGDKLWLLGGILLCVALGHALFGYIGSYLSKYCANRVTRDAQNKVMGHILTMPLSFFDGQRSGELMSRMGLDAGALRKTIRLVMDVVQAPLKLLAIAGVIFYKNWMLATVAFIGLPLAIGPLVFLSKRMRKASRKSREKAADLSSLMVQIFGGFRLVKAYGQEPTEHQRYVTTNERSFSHQMRGARAKALGKAIVESLASFGLIGVLLVGGEMAMRGKLTAGDVVTFLAGLFAMYGPIRAVVKANEEIQETIPGADRLFELNDVRDDMPDSPNAVELQSLQRDICLKDVSFQYCDNTPVLSNINLSIEKGQTVALVGPTGAGKSTLLDLICRFYNPQNGSISIDGIDLREVKHRSLLEKIAIVPQEPFLFNDTVGANILYGRPEASEQEVIEAAQAAAVHEEILEFNDGYKTVVGERGNRLSGGQRQRISIARALLRNSPILVLDEATSSLDSKSEALVQQAIGHLLEGRTTLVIAHRLSTIINADKIVVLVNGRIEAIGPHQELLETSATYEHLWQLQQADTARTAEEE
jgi:ATP-binding cassette, subfamily B, bacterial MsbA